MPQTHFLLNQCVKICQPEKGYRAGLDAVFLAAFVPLIAGQSILDAGMGVGAASLCLAHRVPDAEYYGVEIQQELVVLARQNNLLNQRTINIYEGDLGTCFKTMNFDHVMTNPPYHSQDSHTPSPNAIKLCAHLEQSLSLIDWINFCARRLKPKGTLTLIHRADRLDELIVALRPGFGNMMIFPLYSYAGQKAKRVLIRAQKGSKALLSLHPGMIIHHEDGTYTSQANAILREGLSLL